MVDTHSLVPHCQLAGSFQIAPGRYVGDGYPCFIIAEIGQNHQGDIQLAKALIDLAMECGVHCVKFQKSDLKIRFTNEVLKRPYNSPQAFGKTYGEHRKKLELTDENFIELNQYCLRRGIYFTASGMDKPSFDFLSKLDVPFFKVGSADCTNLPLLKHVSKYKKPIVISTGMTRQEDVYRMYNEIVEENNKLAILQCTSCYPVQPNEINLNVIQTYKKMFPQAVIGYSGHELGIGISLAAVACGAKILERHFTIDHSWKGSDHIASLEPSEMRALVSEVKRIEAALGSCKKEIQDCELPCYKKLGKTVVSTKYLPRGTIINEDMITVKVAETKGWKLMNFYKLVGRKLKRDLHEEETVSPSDVEDI